MQQAKRGTHGVTGATHCEGTLFPAVTVCSGGSVTARVTTEWPDRKVSLTTSGKRSCHHPVIPLSEWPVVVKKVLLFEIKVNAAVNET